MRTPQREIDRVREGELVRVVGRLCHVGAPLIAPITTRTCAYYELAIFDRYGQTHRRDARGQDFELEGERGSVLVIARGGVFEVTRDKAIQEGPYEDRDGELASPVHELHFEEAALRKGALVTVVGIARWGAEKLSTGYRERPSRQVVLSAGPGPLYVSDRRG
jgi:hypothetical protein